MKFSACRNSAKTTLAATFVPSAVDAPFASSLQQAILKAMQRK
jgi:hypothetical protein